MAERSIYDDVSRYGSKSLRLDPFKVRVARTCKAGLNTQQLAAKCRRSPYWAAMVRQIENYCYRLGAWRKGYGTEVPQWFGFQTGPALWQLLALGIGVPVELLLSDEVDCKTSRKSFDAWKAAGRPNLAVWVRGEYVAEVQTGEKP